MKFKAFTLAEVLITLAIIGVIAAISVPSLIQKTNQAELVTAWKKEFATFAQAQDKLTFDNGSMSGLCPGSFSNHDCMVNQFSNVLKVIKKCPAGSAPGNCWHSLGAVKLLNGSSADPAGTKDGAGMILNDGAIVSMFNTSGTCAESATFARCAYGHIDVNGFKSPNVLGKDIHHFYIMLDGFTPPDMTPYSAYTCSAGASASNANDSTIDGYACSNEMLYAKN